MWFYEKHKLLCLIIMGILWNGIVCDTWWIYLLISYNYGTL